MAGIHSVYTYFPSRFVSQAECEDHDGVRPGKYTKGLGQEAMSVVDPHEDIVSMALTACKALMERHGLEPSEIGRIEVGTETIHDKSKSVKTYLMEEFNKHGVYDVLGVDTLNACYGGTSAVFNAVNWVESSMWNGKYAIVLTGDIAIYEPGPARPTGGAGMVALLIGPDAPIALESEGVVSHFEHAYDFYKPNLASDYPVVDGALSNECYQRAVDATWARFGSSEFDYALMHAPYGKLVRKAFHRLVDKDAPLETSEAEYEAKAKPGLALSSACGNMYTGSLWASLNALLCSPTFTPVVGTRILMFSYGSGLAASMFGLRVQQSEAALKVGAPFVDRLAQRTKILPSTFHALTDARERGVLDTPVPIVAPGTYVRTNLDSLGRRSYRRCASERVARTALRILKCSR